MIVKNLLRFLQALKPATVKEMKDIGLRDEVREVIDALGSLFPRISDISQEM